MADFDIKYTDYAPVPSYTIDELKELLYSPDRDLLEKNLKALGDMVSSKETTQGLANQYLDSLEFLEGDNVDIDSYKNRIDEMMNASWDDRKSPQALSALVSDFSKAVGPNGNIGKATRRYSTYKKWLDSEETKDAMKDFSDYEKEFVENEMQEKLLGANSTAEMSSILSSNILTAMPDFNEILSDDAMKSIIGKSEFDKYGYNYITHDTIGLPKELAAYVINGILQGDDKVNAWLRQYNRMHGTNYNLDNCIDANGNVKYDLPNELKGAVMDAYARATAASKTVTPITRAGSGGGGGGYGYGNGNGNGNEKNMTPPMSKEINVQNPSVMDMANLSIMSRDANAASTKDRFMERLNTITKINIGNGDLLEHDFDAILGISKPKNSPIYADNDISNDSIMKKLKKVGAEIVYHKGYYMAITKDNTVLTVSQSSFNLDNLAQRIAAVYKTLNAYAIDHENNIDNISFTKLASSASSKANLDWIKDSGFSILVKNGEDGSYSKPDKETYDVGKLKGIVGYSYANNQSPLCLLGRLDINGREEEVVLIPDKSKMENVRKWVKENLTEYDKNMGAGWIMDNFGYARFFSRIYQTYTHKNSDGTLYNELEINARTVNELGLDHIPAAFYGYRIRMIRSSRNEEQRNTAFYFVDRNGRRVGTYTAQSLTDLINKMEQYFVEFENPKSLAYDQSVTEYFDMKMRGYQYDAIPYTPEYDQFFPMVESSDKPLDDELEYYRLYPNGVKDLYNSTFVETGKNNNGIKVLADKGMPIHTGDMVKLAGTSEYLCIMKYGNGFILVDNNWKYKGDFLPSMAKNTNNVFVKGKKRGQKINIQ